VFVVRFDFKQPNRHCERTGRANARPGAVIASGAKQSISPRKERQRRMDCFASLAMTISRRTFKSRGAKRPSRAFIFRPHGGRGECRVPVAPAASCAIVVVERTRVTTSTPESPGIPARNGFTAYVGLSPVTGLFCHRCLADIVLSLPGRADKTPQNLTPASGRQDHTILPSAAIVPRQRAGDRSQIPENPPCDPIARKTLPRPPHPTPRS
jgi:hypothetical protein